MSVALIEREPRSGDGISSRNSGVIHAGMYYPQPSLKTKFCVEGNKLLYEYAELKNISPTPRAACASAAPSPPSYTAPPP